MYWAQDRDLDLCMHISSQFTFLGSQNVEKLMLLPLKHGEVYYCCLEGWPPIKCPKVSFLPSPPAFLHCFSVFVHSKVCLACFWPLAAPYCWVLIIICLLLIVLRCTVDYLWPILPVSFRCAAFLSLKGPFTDSYSQP